MCPKCQKLPDIRHETNSNAFEDKRYTYWIDCDCGIMSNIFYSLDSILEWWNDRK